MDGRNGFTLIELVVTVTLLGIVLAGTALLGRYAVDPLRAMPETAERSSRLEVLAYLARRLDGMAVLLSWTDSTLTYLDDRGVLENLELGTRRSPGVHWNRGVWLEIDPAGNVSRYHRLRASDNRLPMDFRSEVLVRLCFVNLSTPADTLFQSRNIPFIMPQR